MRVCPKCGYRESEMWKDNEWDAESSTTVEQMTLHNPELLQILRDKGFEDKWVRHGRYEYNKFFLEQWICRRLIKG